MRRGFLAAAAVLAAGTAAALLLWDRGDGGPRPAAGPDGTSTAIVLPPGPALPESASGPALAEVAGTEGALLPVAAPDSRSLDAAGLEAIAEVARRSGTDALLIWHDGALQLEQYGPNVRPFDRLPGRGLEGAVLAMLAGRAVADGLLPSLDEPLSRWLPEWASDPRGRITLRQLALGTSGLGPAPTDPADDLPARLLAAPLQVVPGSRFAPAAVETDLLGLVLARAGGRPLPDHLSDRLWRPLGARTAEMRLDRAGGAAQASSLQAAPRDWLRLGLLILEDGAVGGASLVPADWLAEMQRPTPYARNDGYRVRLGWPHDRNGPLRAAEPFIEPDMVFLAGEGGQRLYVSRAAGLVVLRLGQPVATWDESALPNLIARAVVAVPGRKSSARPGAGQELPPITKPPPVPAVEAVPLEPQP